MAKRPGVYLRADIEISPEDNPNDEVTSVGEDSECPGLTFVDLHSRAPAISGSPSNIERLASAVQNRLHLLLSNDLLLLRWPWLAEKGDESHLEMIEQWLTRLKEVIPDRSVVGNDRCVGVIQHRVADSPLVCWAYEEPADLDGFLSHARAVELNALLSRSNAIWEPSTYHYRLPSGEHTDVFIRLADGIQSPRDAYVVACWLTDRLSDGVGVVVDTGGLTPVLIQLESFLTRFDLEMGPTSILTSYPTGRPTVRRTVERAINPIGTSIIGIQSVSSSGGLLRTTIDELERAANYRDLSYTLDVLVDRHKTQENCTKLSPTGRERTISWLGLGEAPEVEPSGSCELCRDPEKAHYVAVDPRTYGEMQLPTPHLVMPDTSYADDGHLFWERVATCKALAIEANPHPRSRVARGKQTALPVRLILELIADPIGLEQLVKERLRQFGAGGLTDFVEDRLDHYESIDEVAESIRRTGLVVVSASDLAVEQRPAFAGGGNVDLEQGLRMVLAGLGLNDGLPVVADNDSGLAGRIAELEDGASVLVFSWGSVTGLTLRRLKLSVAGALSSEQMDRAVNGLVFHSRPSTPREWSALQNQFRPGALIDLWASCYPWESPLAEEHRLLDRSGLDPNRLSEPGQRFLELRTRFLKLHEVHKHADDDWSPRYTEDEGAPHPEHIFWGMSSSGHYQDQVRGRSLYGDRLSSFAAYAAIGAVIQYTRLNEQPKVAPRWVMFDLGRLVRSYFDAVIICSVLRWLRPGELWWEGDAGGPDSAHDSVSFLLDQVTSMNGNGEIGTDVAKEQVLLVPELLLASALGKVPVGARSLVCERAKEISTGWPEDGSFDLARGAVEVGLALLESD
ncbi:MAG: hypothetical protein KTV68_18965 [Acidimicrobiia bacterium]|nr:hypothetical protein [Acidimicrobiia bacterium]